MPVDIETGSSSVELFPAKMSRNPALAFSRLDVLLTGSLPRGAAVPDGCTCTGAGVEGAGAAGTGANGGGIAGGGCAVGGLEAAGCKIKEVPCDKMGPNHGFV